MSYVCPVDVNHGGEDNQTALHMAAKFKKTLKKSPTTDTGMSGGEETADGEADAAQPNIVVRSTMSVNEMKFEKWDVGVI